MAAEHKYPSVSFFCPAHNEEENLPVLIPKAHEFFKQIAERFEIVIIENGSTDATSKIADDLAKRYPEVRVIHYPKGLGYGGALREGFLHAKYEYVCYTDADNQYDIEEFKEGFRLLKDSDIVSGYVREKAVSFARKIQSAIWNVLIRMLFGVSLKDINCSMKIYKRKVLEAISIESMSAFIDAEMLIKAKRAGFKVKQFPVTHFERTSGVAIGSSRSVIVATMRDTIIFWWKSYKTEILIFSGAFLIRALYALAIQFFSGSHGFVAFSDAEIFYRRLALNLLHHHAFSFEPALPFNPDSYHTPLYPLFLAGLLGIHLPFLAIILVQGVFAAATSVLIYRIGFHLTASRTIAVVAAALASIEPMSIYWSGLFMSDIFFTFFAVWSFYLFMRERPALSGLALGLATLVRPIAMFFLPVYIILLIYWYYGEVWSKLLLRIVIVALPFALVVAPWMARNEALFGSWSLTSAGWYDVYIESVTPFTAQNGIPLPSTYEHPGKDNNFSFYDLSHQSVFKNASLQVIGENKSQYIAFQLRRSVYSLVSDRYTYLIHSVLKSEIPAVFSRIPDRTITLLLIAGQIFWLCIYTLIFFSLARKELLPWWFFFAVMVGINAAISGGINPGGTDMSRYSLPFYPFFFVFAGIGFQKISAWTKPVLRNISAYRASLRTKVERKWPKLFARPASKRDIVLDFWRGMSALMVVVGHYCHAYIAIPAILALTDRLGPTGVKFFFAISGYILTKLMLEEEKTTGKLNIGAFYLRRIFRILPALYVYLAFVALLTFLGWTGTSGGDFLGAFAFICNTTFVCGTNTAHTWTLATEEQFYILWPLLFVLMPVKFRNQFIIILLAIFAGLLSFNLFMTQGFIMNPLSFGCIAIGALYAASERFRNIVEKRGLLIAALCILILITLELPYETRPIAHILYRIFQPFFVLLIIRLTYRFVPLVTSLFFRAVAGVGLASYSIYLYQEVFNNEHFNGGLLKFKILIFAFAAASYFLVEKPAIRLGKYVIARISSRGTNSSLESEPAL